jgi:nucleotide-binding universal stress UspA family protein
MVAAEARTFRRILVAVDASAHSLAALEVAADLARRLEADLAGLFVEEDDLLRLAALPFARAYSADAADLARIDPEAMRRALHVQAERARRALAAVAARHHVAWSFRIARGSAGAALIEAARDCDLLGMGKASAAMTRHARLGGTARVALSRGTCATLMMQRDGALGDRVVALYTGAERALATAAALARDLSSRLEVIVAAGDPAAAERLVRDARAWLDAHGLRATALSLTEADPKRLARAIERTGRGLVVAAPAGVLGTGAAVEALVEELDAPFLLSR